uniref:Uncharacterized protein n=1 Tax=Desulfovibrio sp. U5L TaxID=596152 RepID=I2Q2M0_9BACT
MVRHNYPSLSPILHQVVLRAPSGIGSMAIADLLGWKYSTMMSELSGQPGHKFGVDKLLPLLDVTDSDVPMHFLARERGGVFIRLPAESCGVDPVHQQCMVAIKEFGELIAACAEALLDNDLKPDDRASIMREGHEAVTAIMGLLRLVESK